MGKRPQLTALEKIQRVTNWHRRRAQRSGLQPKDWISRARRYVGPRCGLDHRSTIQAGLNPFPYSGKRKIIDTRECPHMK